MDTAKLFQVSETDLEDLERILPEIAETLTPTLTGRLRVQLRRCQSILSSVRWSYGPPTEVHIIDCDGGDNES
jgi:hypothetical protein